jgi:hypothetical protein
MIIKIANVGIEHLPIRVARLGNAPYTLEKTKALSSEPSNPRTKRYALRIPEHDIFDKAPWQYHDYKKIRLVQSCRLNLNISEQSA